MSVAECRVNEMLLAMNCLLMLRSHQLPLLPSRLMRDNLNIIKMTKETTEKYSNKRLTFHS
jgi:hypothetical protein